MNIGPFHEATTVWLASRSVIARALRDLIQPNLSRDRAESIAAAILARLASFDPPILPEFVSEVPDTEEPLK